MSLNVAVVGATGAVGEAMLEILAEREFPADEVFALASANSEGKRLPYNSTYLKVQRLDTFDFSKVDIALFSAGGSISAEFAPKAWEQGAVVIDNTSHFRYEDDIPLVVPEINAHEIERFRNRGIIANPNCSTIQMVVALKPIYDAVGISRINVATYQAVSGAGTSAINELAGQTGALLSGQDVEIAVHPTQIAFNVIPQIDIFMDNGYTREEMKMVWETQKIFADENIRVNPTCVRVPVFYGHSEAVHIETEAKITADMARRLLAQSPGIKLFDGPEGTAYPTPVNEAVGSDMVHVGRVREDLSCDLGLNMWVVSDNVRKGAALNSVQIAELLLKEL
ncbi:MAG: aspartate-semialdehyde dehydrogenase [Pseudomonadales bacterium]|nr:aspartate-semialdehyde dehydrogenase [Pseudomonadales bacterium]